MDVARILLVRDKVTRARTILGKVYPKATPEEIDAKIRAMSDSVRRSIEIHDTTSMVDRVRAYSR